MILLLYRFSSSRHKVRRIRKIPGKKRARRRNERKGLSYTWMHTWIGGWMGRYVEDPTTGNCVLAVIVAHIFSIVYKICELLTWKHFVLVSHFISGDVSPVVVPLPISFQRRDDSLPFLFPQTFRLASSLTVRSPVESGLSDASK